MPLPVIANTVRAAVEGLNSSGAPWANVLHFRFTGTPPVLATNITALDLKIVKLYGGPNYASGLFILSPCKSTVTITQVTYTILDGTSASTVIGHALAGGQVSNAMPGEVATVVSFRTSTRGRSYRGRAFHPPMTTGNYNADGTIAASVLTGYQAQWAAFQADLVTITWEHVVASYLRTLATNVTSYSVDNKADVQRRRK